jgi:hypothetical protein
VVSHFVFRGGVYNDESVKLGVNSALKKNCVAVSEYSAALIKPLGRNHDTVERYEDNEEDDDLRSSFNPATRDNDQTSCPQSDGSKESHGGRDVGSHDGGES